MYCDIPVCDADNSSGETDFDLILDCAGSFSRLTPRIGYVELTHSGIDAFQNNRRPVFFADFTDENLREEQQAFLLGNDLLVIPRWAVNPVIPQGDWDELKLEAEDDGYQAIVALRPGAILPYLGHDIQSTAEYTCDSITLFVNPLDNGQAEGNLYDDEGEGFDYRNGGYALLQFTCTEYNADSLSVSITQSEGNFERPARYFRVAIVGGEETQYSDWTSSNTILVPKVDDVTESLDLSKVGAYFIAGTFTNWFNGDEDMRLMLKDPAEDGTLTSDRLYFEAGTYEMKFANTDNWSNTDWGAAEGNNSLTGTAIKGPDSNCKNIKFTIETSGNYYITFNPQTLQYAVVRTYDSLQKDMYVGGTYNNWTMGGGYMELVADNQWEVTEVYMPAGDWELKFANTNDWSDKDWGGVEGLNGTAVETTGGKPNLKFSITDPGLYTILFNDKTLIYSLRKEEVSSVQNPVAEQNYIYPNPTKDLVNVHLAADEGTIEIFSITGQCVMQQKLTGKVSTLNIAQLTKGTYLVKIFEQGETTVCKLLKD